MCRQVDEVELTPEEKFQTPEGLPEPGIPVPPADKPLNPPTHISLMTKNAINPLEGKDEFDEVELSVVSEN